MEEIINPPFRVYRWIRGVCAFVILKAAFSSCFASVQAKFSSVHLKESAVEMCKLEEESEAFRAMLESFEHHCSMKLKVESISNFVDLLNWFAKIAETASHQAECQPFIAYCRCQILSCFAALTLLKQRKVITASGQLNLSDANSSLLASYSYSMVLQSAHTLKSAHHMLGSLLLDPQRKEEFFAALKGDGTTKLINKSIAMFAVNPKFKSEELFALFRKEPCLGNVGLTSDLYSSSIRYLMLHDTTNVALKRLIWLWLFNWDPAKERMLLNEEDNAFDKLPYAPEDFDNAAFDNLTVLDISVFIHLSVFVAAYSRNWQQRLPFVASGKIAVKKSQEAFWKSVNAFASGRKTPEDVENICHFLRCIRLVQQPMLCLSLLHTVARMVYGKVEAMPTSRKDKLHAANYDNSYWCAIAAIIGGEKRVQTESTYFAFFEKALSQEEKHNMNNESFLDRAKLLLHRGEVLQAERLLSNCDFPAAAILRLELCKQLANSIDDDVSTENQCRKEHYQKLADAISEQLSTKSDGFDESILSNQEWNLISKAVKQDVSCPNRETHRRATNLQSSVDEFAARPRHYNYEGGRCDCRQSFEKLFETNQQILLKFGSLLESIPSMFSTSFKCIFEQNQQLVLVFQEMIKSFTQVMIDKRTLQAGEYEQYLKMLFNYFPNQQANVTHPRDAAAAYGTAPWRAPASYPFFSSPVATSPPQQQFPVFPHDTHFTVPPPSTLASSGPLFGTGQTTLPTVFSFGGWSQTATTAQSQHRQETSSAVLANTDTTSKAFFSNLPPVNKAVQQDALPKQEPPAVTTKAPAATTQAPAATTQAPAVTTKAPAATTKAPAVTTKAPAVTTKAPAATTKAPAAPTFPALAAGTPTFPALAAATPTFPSLAAATPTFPALAAATPTFPSLAAATPTFPALAAATPIFNMSGQTDFSRTKFDSGITPTTAATRPIELTATTTTSSNLWNQFRVGPAEESPVVKSEELGFASLKVAPAANAPIKVAEPKADIKVEPSKGGADFVDTASATVKPPSLFGTAGIGQFIRPPVLSVPFGKEASSPSFSAAKSETPFVQSSWPPVKAKEVPSSDTKASIFTQAATGVRSKSNVCIPAEQLQSIVEEGKDVKSGKASSPLMAQQSTAAEGSVGADSSTEEYEDEVVETHYEPVVPLPDLIEVVTGEEEETIIFKERAKMFRFVSDTKEYKECGIGDLKLLKHPVTNKYRIVMRRDLVHKLCANQPLYTEMALKPLAKRENSYCWIGHDYSSGELVSGLFAVRFRNEEAAAKFKDTVETCIADLKRDNEAAERDEGADVPSDRSGTVSEQSEQAIVSSGSKTPSDNASLETAVSPSKSESMTEAKADMPPHDNTPLGSGTEEKIVFSFGQAVQSSTPITDAKKPPGGLFCFGNFSTKQYDSKASSVVPSISTLTGSVSDDECKSGEEASDYEADAHYEPVIPLPDLVEVVTGEENEEVLFSERARLYRISAKEYKERGTGQLKILANPDNGRSRLVMRRDVILNVIANHWIKAGMKLSPHKKPNVYFWQCQNYCDDKVAVETIAARFKNEEAAARFHAAFTKAVEQDRLRSQDKGAKGVLQNGAASVAEVQSGDGLRLARKPSDSWNCTSCLVTNDASTSSCVCCKQAKPKQAPLATNESTYRTSSDFGSTKHTEGDSSRRLPSSSSSVEAVDLTTADVVSCESADSTRESFQAKSEVSAEGANRNGASTVVENEGDQIKSYTSVQRLLRQYGKLLEANSSWPDVLFIATVGLTRQEDDECTSYGRVVLKVEQNLELCPYGRIVARNERTKKVACNHFIKEVIQYCRPKSREFTWSLLNADSGQVRTYVVIFDTADALNKFLAAWKDAKGSKESQLTSSLSSKAISILCNAFSKRTAIRYSTLARQLSLAPDFYEYLLRDGCGGCRACEGFKQQRSPDILVFDQVCKLYMEDKEVLCRIEVWYLDNKRCYWTQVMTEENEDTIYQLYESEPFADVREVNREKLQIGCNVEVNNVKCYVGITFLSDAAFDEFRRYFLDHSNASQGAVPL
uniref:RanBP2-type domain-containing protein n=1 Tax=Trichuris muris TaxID=70415 RepID=A0A5S6QPB7_TRIMR